MSFRAFRVLDQGLNKGSLQYMDEANLSEGDVVVDVLYSSVNFKDALAVSGKGKILKSYPLNPGIDAAGTVRSSKVPAFKAGDKVIVTGCGLGETKDGGFSERIRVPADWVVPLPSGLSLKEAMIYGTAGFTAGLAAHRFLVNDQTPDKGPIVVTGASGGVGSLSVAILSKLGFEVIAVSGKREMKDELKAIGASKVFHPDELELGSRPLESVKFGGVVDNVGGKLLEQLLPHVNLWGNVASIGLAGGSEFRATVMPFILRGVSILGISSANCPRPLRLAIWKMLAGGWRPHDLSSFEAGEIALEEVPAFADRMLGRQSHKRTLVKI